MNNRPKGKFDLIGTREGLSENPPVSSPSANPKSGTWQLMGTSVSMSKKEIPSPSSNPKEGIRTLIGDTAPLSRKPIYGMGNADTITMSTASHKENNNAAERGRHGRKRG